MIAGVWTLDALLQVALGSSPLFFALDQVKQLNLAKVYDAAHPRAKRKKATE